MICSILDLHCLLLHSFYGMYPVKTEHWQSELRNTYNHEIIALWIVLFTRKLKSSCESLRSETDS